MATNLGPIQKLLDDDSISEIMINGYNKVFAEKNGKKVLTSVKFSSEEELYKMVDNIYSSLGKRVAKDVPYADVCMEDGTRINAIIPPLARFGISVTFRKFAGNIKTLEDLIRNQTLSQKAADLLVACIKGKINIIFSGGTAVGKTTTLQILSNYFSDEERVITIEDAAELKINRANYISLETRTPDQDGKGGVSIRDLIRNALRMAPDRLVIGEVRGEEAIDMIQAMATGHTGTIGIVHGNSPKDVISRLETMVLMSGINLPLWEVRKLIASTINLIVHQERSPDGARRITYITEVRGLDREEVILNDLFTFHFEKISEDGKVIGVLKPSIKYYPLFFQKFQKLNLLGDHIFVKD
ncbi:MAG: CpaF family protein [Candidatus Omnitrophota bacterium]|jgi:pilus assembly protein CpaF|nr:MAG: CpaF family protein [Candidatus Omnitrophota bacterium]